MFRKIHTTSPPILASATQSSWPGPTDPASIRLKDVTTSGFSAIVAMPSSANLVDETMTDPWRTRCGVSVTAGEIVGTQSFILSFKLFHFIFHFVCYIWCFILRVSFGVSEISVASHLSDGRFKVTFLAASPGSRQVAGDRHGEH